MPRPIDGVTVKTSSIIREEKYEHLYLGGLVFHQPNQFATIASGHHLVNHNWSNNAFFCSP